MKNARLLVAGLAVLATAATAGSARAQSYTFNVRGPGLGGSVMVTYGPARDARYSNAYQITGISGTFSDTNNGLDIRGASILGLVPVVHSTPEEDNLLAPDNFSRFVAGDGTLSYTNLFWPGGSPQTASDYPFHGGFLDIYGLLFDIGDGRVVNLWSDGNMDGGPITYGAAVATANGTLDYVFAGVTVTPEPGSLALLGAGSVGLVGVLARRRRAAA